MDTLHLPDAVEGDHRAMAVAQVVKIVLDSNRMMGDKECGEVSYDNALVEGLTANTAGSRWDMPPSSRRDNAACAPNVAKARGAERID